MAKIIWNDGAFGWNGPVGVWLANKGRELEVGAKASVGVETGALQANITTDRHPPSTTPGELVLDVGANPGGDVDGYAIYHHEGTKPHEIKAKPGKTLRFRSGGRWVYTKRVMHPGTKPNNYLTRWLRILF